MVKFTQGMKSLMKLREWIEDSWWSWKNFWYFRFDSYEDRIDILAFWEELNLGYYQMRDEFLMSQFLMSQPNFDPYNLSGRDPYYSYVLNK